MLHVLRPWNLSTFNISCEKTIIDLHQEQENHQNKRNFPRCISETVKFKLFKSLSERNHSFHFATKTTKPFEISITSYTAFQRPWNLSTFNISCEKTIIDLHQEQENHPNKLYFLHWIPEIIKFKRFKHKLQNIQITCFNNYKTIEIRVTSYVTFIRPRNLSPYNINCKMTTTKFYPSKNISIKTGHWWRKKVQFSFQRLEIYKWKIIRMKKDLLTFKFKSSKPLLLSWSIAFCWF